MKIKFPVSFEMRIYNEYYLPITTYRFETWILYKKALHKPQTHQRAISLRNQKTNHWISRLPERGYDNINKHAGLNWYQRAQYYKNYFEKYESRSPSKRWRIAE